MRSTLLLVGLAGCAPPATIDEACGKGYPGDDIVSAESFTFFERVTCHRRFVGLGAARVVPEAQQAADAHGLYLTTNGRMDPESPGYAVSLDMYFMEDEGDPGFTGVTALDRLQAANMVQALESAMGTWDLLITDATRDPDEYFHNPYLRDALFQPSWIGAGMSLFENPELRTTAGYMNLLYAFPPGRRMLKPVVYPRDGQIDVPVSYRPYGVPEDPLSVAGTIGYPITITVGSDSVDADTNPYQLVVTDAVLLDDAGAEVELVQAPPGDYPWGTLNATAILGPRTPLRPGTTYQFSARVAWNIREVEVQASFTTVGDGVVVE